MGRLALLVVELVDVLADLVADRLASRPVEPSVERVLDVRSAAEILGVSRTTTYQLIASGELRSLKVRGRRLIPASAVSSLLTGSHHE